MIDARRVFLPLSLAVFLALGVIAYPSDKTALGGELEGFNSLSESNLSIVSGNSIKVGLKPLELLPPILMKIRDCESSNNPNAINGTYGKSGGMGLYQLIYQTVEDCEKALGREIDPFDSYDNTQCALWLYETRGTAPWGFSPDNPNGYINGIRWGSWDCWGSTL